MCVSLLQKHLLSAVIRVSSGRSLSQVRLTGLAWAVLGHLNWFRSERQAGELKDRVYSSNPLRLRSPRGAAPDLQL